MREELEQIMRKQLAYAKMPRAELLAIIDRRIAEAAGITEAAQQQQQDDIDIITEFVMSQQDDAVEEVKVAADRAEAAATKVEAAVVKVEEAVVKAETAAKTAKAATSKTAEKPADEKPVDVPATPRR
jgi:hypothetical protein